jgi:hypothetical protein
MNEQIRLLSEQAHRSTADELTHLQRVHNRTYDLYESAAIYNEKFAELIVRGCMKEAWDEIIDDENIAAETDPLIREYLIGQNQGIVDAVIRFRNHFGVEE